jgi:hypothetical protein
MEEQLINFDTAKLAKERGFNIICNTAYHEDGVLRSCNPDFYLKGYNNKGKAILAPTQSLIQKWLREKHNLHIDMYRSAMGFQCNLDKAECGTHIKIVVEDSENTYEESLEIGLQAALKMINL